MPYYEDTSGGLHFLSTADVANGGLALLPTGCTEITDAQAATLQAPPAPTAAQALASTVSAALAAGLTVSSTSAPAVNGTYPLDSATQFEINSVVLFVQTNGDFPGGLSAYPWDDTSGAAHIFPSVAVFKEWATAVANYVAALKLYGAGATGATLPAASVTIA
jgi:hypothetical protein